ncbi:MAG: molybdenum cofactor biosynthesis protein MoaE [Euryarchaeota archaeon]|nr:molybdenum cofactor biosynthesis protein MoaE [Euryarchaeota archaeon]
MADEGPGKRFKASVLLFAEPREIVGASRIEIELPEGADVETLLQMLFTEYPRLARFKGHLAVGLNLEYCGLGAKVAPGDELALLPPVSGGSHSRVRIQGEAFDVGALTEALERRGAGSVVTFIGIVRTEARGEAVETLTYECYEPMAVVELERLVARAMAKWGLVDALVVHRVGTLRPGERIVFIGVASPHREEGFEATKFLIEELKVFAPIWKKEATVSGTHWVEGARHGR